MNEILTLIGSHSLILGSIPDKINLKMVNDKNAKDIKCPDGKCSVEGFGLFDTSTPNYATYYPDVTAEDLKPKDEEFIYPVFRLLSSVTVNKNSYSPTFFPTKVLKASMSKLIGQTVFIDHEMTTGNALGTVMEVEWQEEYTTDDGTVVPAGINGKMKLDGKTHPGIARAIMMDPPAIHSNSVTIRFAWEQSHKTMPADEFYNKLGSTDKDGKLIQKVATLIDSYWETSLVPHGADPFAKKIGEDGKIVSPHFAGHRDEQFSLNLFSYKTQEDTTILSSFKTKEEVNFKNNIMNDKLKMALIAVLGLTETTLKDENFDFEAKFKSIKEASDKYNSLDDSLKNLKLVDGKLSDEDVTKLSNINVLELKANAKIGTDHLEARQAEAVRLYTVLKGDKVEEAMTSTLKSATPEAVEVFIADFNTQVEKLFPLQCNDCNSQNVARLTSEQEGEEGKEGNKNKGDNSHQELSYAEIEAKLRAKRRKPSFEDEK